MRVLLDTSLIFNFMDRPSAFSDLERRILEASGTEVFVSAVSVWEMRLKYQSRYPSGDRKSRFAPENVLDALEPQNITFLPMTMRHAATILSVPLMHRDPFGEMLLVQAQEEGLRLLTRDRALLDHPLAVAVRALGKSEV
ncbi:MAG: type II toxin-antitoxin system VapC family toxin [Gammaproteobacteria bacterium]|nr:type II toxin-antitoxin system VapC family toxin [Gammaproteobacteria bacterium]